MRPSLTTAFSTIAGEYMPDASFLNPPDHSRPWCYWMWMNGNITREGITLDLEAMKRIGIGGVIAFNVGLGIPRGPVDYGSDEWMDIMEHTAKEAGRIGISLAMQNSPGYSGCGGPWITPELSMQQLVWTEKLVANRQDISIQLSRPYAKRGFYRDAFVIAYPSLPAEKMLMKDHVVQVLADGQKVDKRILLDGNPETKIRLEPAGNNSSVLLFELDTSFEARAITIYRQPEIPKDLYDGDRDYPPVFKLEASLDGVSFREICLVNTPPLRAMDTPASASFAVVEAKYYRLITHQPTWVSCVELHNGPRLAGWPGKTNYTHGISAGETPPLEKELIIDSASVIDITRYMDDAGNLTWKAPQAGNWTILRIGHTTTGEEPAAHPDSAKGLEVDKLRKEALDLHFDQFLDKVIKRLKPFIGSSFKGIMADSWEAGKQSWAQNLPEEFAKRRNYAIIQWMPTLTGRIVDSAEESERFLWDVRKTHADLLSENFYGHMHQRCREAGLGFYGEPYGDGSFDSLQSAGNLDVPMAEFWTRYIYGSDNTSKQAASAVHIYGKKVAAAEAFTGMPATSKWTDYPYSLKAEGDYFFSLGINRLVLHTYVHQPFQTAQPGMTMGPFGTHFDRNNTWTNQAYGWTDYLKRAQYLLQQGLVVADTCYFKGDDPTSGIPDPYLIMPAGYLADVVGPDALTRFKIEKGLIVLPDGMSYRLMIMPELPAILPETLGKLIALVSNGMTLVVSGKPAHSYGRQGSDTVKQKISGFYGDLDGKLVKHRQYGQGLLIWNDEIKPVLEHLKIDPDFIYTAENPDAAIHYIHKKLDGMEFYFVSNHCRRHEKIRISMRIDNRQPEIWNAESGESYPVAVFQNKHGRTLMPLELGPAESVFIVFKKKTEIDGYMAVIKDGVALYSVEPYPPANRAPYANVQNNFTIALWVKPDTFAHEGKSMIFHAPEGAKLYGHGHAAIGLGAGQNGIFVYERTIGKSRLVLSAAQPLQGWTHLALVCHNGAPVTYINGLLAATGLASEKIIHPGMKAPAVQEQFSSFFEGNYTEPVLFQEVLTPRHVNSLFLEGIPAPQLSETIELRRLSSGRTEARIWKNGNYTLQGIYGQKNLGTITGCGDTLLTGEWELDFSGGSGISGPVKFPKLMSLHRHDDFNIRHFSGTVSYKKNIQIDGTDLQPGKRLFLDLGRVEVIAEIKLNGKAVGIAWKEPYRLDITDFASIGNNSLEIKVTTLLANRQIGDEYLPAENTYTKDGPITELPEWFTGNRPKPGERKTFSVWHNINQSDPLLESGLLGPVTLRKVIVKVV